MTSLKKSALRLGACVAALGTLPSGAIASPTLTTHGVVLIDRGNGFERVPETTTVRPGDTVMVNEGSAQLACENGWSGNLEAGRVYRIEATICEAPSQHAAEPGIGQTTTLGTGGVSTIAMIGIGAALAVGVGVGLLSDSRTGSKKGVSP